MVSQLASVPVGRYTATVGAVWHARA